MRGVGTRQFRNQPLYFPLLPYSPYPCDPLASCTIGYCYTFSCLFFLYVKRSLRRSVLFTMYITIITILLLLLVIKLHELYYTTIFIKVSNNFCYYNLFLIIHKFAFKLNYLCTFKIAKNACFRFYPSICILSY